MYQIFDSYTVWTYRFASFNFDFNVNTILIYLLYRYDVIECIVSLKNKGYLFVYRMCKQILTQTIYNIALYMMFLKINFS